jgi:hypothetical protein
MLPYMRLISDLLGERVVSMHVFVAVLASLAEQEARQY